MILYDLTQPLHALIPLWNTTDRLLVHTILDYTQCSTDGKFRVQNIALPCGSGTHIDAPAHSIPGGRTIDQIPLTELIKPVTIIDITTENPERKLTISDIITHEIEYGPILSSSVVLIKTGWSRYWSTPEKYRNNYNYPSITQEAGEYLLTKKISGLGIDTLSPDTDLEKFPIHQLFLKADTYLLENLLIPQIPYSNNMHITIMPLKIENGTEAPCRIFLTNPKI